MMDRSIWIIVKSFIVVVALLLPGMIYFAKLVTGEIPKLGLLSVVGAIEFWLGLSALFCVAIKKVFIVVAESISDGCEQLNALIKKAREL